MRIPQHSILLFLLASLFCTEANAQVLQKFKDKIQDTRQNVNRTLEQTKSKTKDQISTYTDKTKDFYQTNKDNVIRKYENIRPVIQQYGSEAVQSVKETYDRFGPQVGTAVATAYQRYGPEIASKLTETYNKFGPEIGTAIHDTYLRYGPRIGENIREAYNKYGPELGQQITAIYDQYGPVIGEKIRQAYDQYGPQVGSYLAETYQRYGPVIGTKIHRAYVRYGEEVSRSLTSAYLTYGPQVGDMIVSAYNNYGPKMGSYIQQTVARYGEQAGFAVSQTTSYLVSVLKNPDTYAIAIGATLAIADQTGASAAINDLCQVVRNSEIVVKLPEGMEKLDDRFITLYKFTLLDKDNLVHGLRIMDGYSKTIGQKLKSTSLFKPSEMNQCFKVLAGLEGLQHELRNGTGNLAAMVQIKSYINH